MNGALLPMTREDMQQRGWDGTDFICVTGDAYVDHPSFGIAIVARLLESMGFRVAMLSQPQNDADYTRHGRPLLGFFVTGGNIDSMVSHYTAALRRRSDDPYTAGNKAGKRPDRAAGVYCQNLKRLYPDTPVVLGGLEASFRRFAHYDYWDDCVKPSILAESGADLLTWGMGERQTREIALRLQQGEAVQTMHDIRGTCYLGDATQLPANSISVASFEKISQDKKAFAKAFRQQSEQQDHVTGKAVIQKHGDRYLVQNPPALPLERNELDAVFALPFTRTYHPAYEPLGGVKAIEEVEFSIQHNRGCFGGCSFCSIAFHQGRAVTSRSEQSVLAEAQAMIKSRRFKGYIHDVGGATANFRAPACKKQEKHGVCMHRSCLAPTACPNLEVSHSEYLHMLRSLRELPGVKRVFVRSGLRFDYINHDRDGSFLRELVTHHVSGQLKVAPEHCSAEVLDRMGKPHIGEFERFSQRFYQETKKAGKEQYLVPYLMSSHPGSTLKHAVAMAIYLKKNRLRPEQVQDFYPTPGTASTCMFYTGLDPATMKPVYVAKSSREKAMQRALLQFFKPENHDLVRQALREVGRTDLIGTAAHCLVHPAAKVREEGRTDRMRTGNRSGGQADQKSRQTRLGDRKGKGEQARNRGKSAGKHRNR